MMTINSNTPLIIHSNHNFYVEKMKKIKKSHQKQQIFHLFIYRIKQFQSYTINHYTNQKIIHLDSVRRMMTIGSNTPLIIHSYHNFYVEKWKNKKLIESKTTNISYIHLQNQMIPIKYYLSLIKSKNRLHRQCEAYDDYQSKCFIFIHS